MMDFNILLAFSQLVLDKNEAEKVALADQLGIDLNEYNARIKGKEKEAEFADSPFCPGSAHMSCPWIAHLAVC